jgi:hypothetical protein
MGGVWAFFTSGDWLVLTSHAINGDLRRRQKMRDPKTAREIAGIAQCVLAFKAQISLSTVFRCEKDGEYPKNALVKRRYLAALGPAALLPNEEASHVETTENQA